MTIVTADLLRQFPDVRERASEGRCDLTDVTSPGTGRPLQALGHTRFARRPDARLAVTIKICIICVGGLLALCEFGMHGESCKQTAYLTDVTSSGAGRRSGTPALPSARALAAADEM